MNKDYVQEVWELILEAKKELEEENKKWNIK